MKQPDFEQFFRHEVPCKLDFRVRESSNGEHDMEYLRGYLMDAEMPISGVRLRGKKLTINLHRRCWELNDIDTDIYYETESRLSFFHVEGIRWEFQFPIDDLSPKTDVIGITTIFYTSSYYKVCEPEQSFEVALGCQPGWFLYVALSNDEFQHIWLRDLEVPKLVTRGRR